MPFPLKDSYKSLSLSVRSVNPLILQERVPHMVMIPNVNRHIPGDRLNP
jgi:hypothetical protein